MTKNLLIIAHVPSPNTQALCDAVFKGASHKDIDDIETQVLTPFEARADHVLRSDAVILGTTENLGYMSGALKDFFDRSYYGCLDHTDGLPFAFYVRAGHDGTGTKRAIESIASGMRWKLVLDPLICRGAWDTSYLNKAEELGLGMAAGMEAGVF